MTVHKVQPQALFQRSLDGRVLYSHVVVAEAKSLIFISGQLAGDKSGQIVAPGNMREQIKQVGRNLRAALEEIGASLDDLIRSEEHTSELQSP